MLLPGWPQEPTGGTAGGGADAPAGRDTMLSQVRELRGRLLGLEALRAPSPPKLDELEREVRRALRQVLGSGLRPRP